MEKRIKTLYTITIVAILAFMVMQGYWLYGRYEFSLTDYERDLNKRIEKCVDGYNEIREHSSDHRTDSLNKNGEALNTLTIPKFSLQLEYGDSIKTTRTSKVYTYIFSAHELLGLKPGTPLTKEQKKKAARLAEAQMTEPADSAVFDASGAKNENEAWIATKNVQTERKCPFTVEGIDSVMNKNGIKADITLVKADSMVWKTTVDYHTSAISPSLTITRPYSQLQGKIVRIVSPISPFDVLPGMGQALIITLLVSCLLIICLVLQFSTVLKLSRLDKMRNSFITAMIHELKRPISTLKMCVSGIENERMMADNDTKQEIVTETRTALDNLSAYFSRLRDITFNNVEQIPLNIQSVSPRMIFDSVAAGTIIPGNKKVTLTNDIDAEIEITADSSHLFSILNNLVENAIKYSGGNVAITATATVDADSVEIRISDTGNGIPAGELPHIFRRFYRGKASAGEQPGMGLGLTYVKLLVEAHGGEIHADSTEGRGTCFTIRLPQ